MTDAQRSKVSSPDELAGRLGDLAVSSSQKGSKKISKSGFGKNPQKRAWRGPIKQSAFVFLIRGDYVYAVRNRHGELGVPGGKREHGDKGLWGTACREFCEETGVEIPRKAYSHFEWGNSYHTIRVFYRFLTDVESSDLPVGEITGDPDGEEVETLWVYYPDTLFRHHISKAFEIFRAIC